MSSIGPVRFSTRISKPASAAVSIASNATLIALKLAAAAVTGSVAILSEALHSMIDLIASVIAFVSVRRADEPADAEHPYGHEKVESLAASIEGMLILVGAALIVYESVHRLVIGAGVENLGFGIAVIGFSAVANGGVSLFLRRQARRYRSPALAGDAAHLGTDALTSLGVLAGLVLVEATGAAAIDSAVAIVVAVVIVFAGVRILRQSTPALVDEAPPPAEMDRIEEAIARARSGRRRLSGTTSSSPDQRPAPLHRPPRPVPQRHHPGAGPRARPSAPGRDRVGARRRRGPDPRRAGELAPGSSGVARALSRGLEVHSSQDQRPPQTPRPNRLAAAYKFTAAASPTAATTML